MDYKTILVHVDDSARCIERIRLACQYAQDWQATVEGVYVVSATDVTPSVAELLPDAVVNSLLHKHGDAQHAAERLFRDAVAQAGVTSVEWSAPAGPPYPTFVSYARAADLIIVGQAAPKDSDAHFFSRLAESVVLLSARPVLALPYVGNFSRAEHVFVGWNHSREAARAVADAIPFLVRAKTVTIVNVRTREADVVGGAPARKRLVAYLQRHGVLVSATYEDAIEEITIGEWLLSRAADSSADMIVIGGYSHSRVQELLLGGVTRSILETMTVPVLMSH